MLDINDKELWKNRRRLFWWSLAGLWICIGLQPIDPLFSKIGILFMIYPLWFNIIELIRLNKEKGSRT